MCVYVYMLTDLKIAVWSARVVNWGGAVQVDLRLNCPFSVIMVPMLYI